MKKQTGYCLIPRGESLLTLKLKPEGGNFDYRVELCEILDPHSLSSGRQRELSRNGKRQLLLLDNGDCTLLQSRLPALAERERRQALLGLIHKYKGAGDGGWIVDAHLRGAAPASDSGDERIDVTGLFVEQGVLARLLGSLAPRSIRPQRALPSALALESLLRRELLAGAEAAGGAWNLVHLGDEENFLAVGDARGPLFFRELPRDLSGGTDREEYVRRLSTEVERSNFFARQGEQSVQVKRAFFSGDPELLSPLLKEMESVAGIECAAWNPERRFMVDGAAASWELLLPLAGAVAAVEDCRFNLIQRREEDRPSRRFRSRALFAGATALLAILPIVIGGTTLARRTQERTLFAQQGQIDAARRAARAAARDYLMRRSLLARQSRLDELESTRGDLGALLRDVARRMPTGVRLKALGLTRSARGEYLLKLNGECVAGRSDMAQAQFLTLRRALAQSPYLAEETEPNRLKIDGDIRRDGDTEVLFTLEYRLQERNEG